MATMITEDLTISCKEIGEITGLEIEPGTAEFLVQFQDFRHISYYVNCWKIIKTVSDYKKALNGHTEEGSYYPHECPLKALLI